jgi:Rrf2 family protein
MFFRISNKCHDGLLFMGKLAGRHGAGMPLTVEDAAGDFLSAGYLEQIASTLRAAGLIEGKRGPGGGYVLTRDPKAIAVREVIEAIEGKIDLVDCQGGTCPRERGCGSKHVWNALQKRVGETLGAMNLSEIAETAIMR